MDSGITAFLRDLAFESFHDTFIEWFHFVAGPANQVVVMVMSIPRPDFMPGRSIDPGHPLHQFFFFQDRDESENGGEIAALFAHLLVDVG